MLAKVWVLKLIEIVLKLHGVGEGLPTSNMIHEVNFEGV